MTDPRKGALVLRNKLLAMGLPGGYAVHCANEALAWYDDKPQERAFMFRLRRAEYCRRRYFARWGLRVGRRHTTCPPHRVRARRKK